MDQFFFKTVLYFIIRKNDNAFYQTPTDWHLRAFQIFCLYRSYHTLVYVTFCTHRACLWDKLLEEQLYGPRICPLFIRSRRSALQKQCTNMLSCQNVSITPHLAKRASIRKFTLCPVVRWTTCGFGGGGRGSLVLSFSMDCLCILCQFFYRVLVFRR